VPTLRDAGLNGLWANSFATNEVVSLIAAPARPPSRRMR